MILDKQNLFSEDQAITTTAVSTNIIDLGTDDSEVVTPNNKDAEILAQVTTTFVGATSVALSLYTDADVAFGSATLMFTTAAVANASLVAGYKFKVPTLPEDVERYVRMTYTVVGTASAGTVMAGLKEMGGVSTGQ